MSIFRNVSVSGAGSDIWQYMKVRRQHNWLLWVLACLPPAILIFAVQNDVADKSVPPPPTPFFIQSWPATRTLEETRAHQAELQKIQDVKDLERRELYKALGRMSGMDVEAIEREAKAKEAAKKRDEAQADSKVGNQAVGAAK